MPFDMPENAHMDISAVETFLLQREATLGLGCFGAIFVVMMLWEVLAPKRALSVFRLQRWTNNIGLLLLNSIVLRLLFPAAAVAIAYAAADAGWGMFNRVDLPDLLEVVTALVLLDLAIYLQQLLMHRLPLPWRLHRVHHSILLRETNSNYGFNLSLRDRLFRSFIDQPQKGHLGMTIGVPRFRGARQVERLPGMLAMPFADKQ